MNRPARAPAPLLPLLLSTLLIVSALPALAAQPMAPVLPVSVRQRLPHDPAAFTQGLVFHQGLLFESTGLYGQSSLRRTDPQTGRVLAITRLPATLFGEGLTLCPPAPGKAPRLVQLTWREGRILTYDPHTLRQTGSHHLRGEGWGLTFDGARLILSDGTDTLRLLSPSDFSDTGSLAVRDGNRPVRELNELEWVHGWLLANVWGGNRLAVIRPPGAKHPGQVAAWLDLAPLRQELNTQAEATNGIAFDPDTNTLFVTGKRWDTLFTLNLPPLLAHPPD